MPTRQNKKGPFKNPILWVFLISFIYWIYLASTSHMVISHDAISYEAIGGRLAKGGWLDYFSSGPHREPFYPLLISFSMKLGSALDLPYQLIQVFLQLFILFITQLMSLRILRLLGINPWISAFTILYLGVSPAIVNSALSLYSEIATYPLILAIILFMYHSWVSFLGPKSRVILFAILSGLTFVLMTLSKGIFEVITPVFIGLFFLSTLLTRNRKFILNALMHLLIVLTVFCTLITGYRLINKLLNGNFMLTDRGAVMLYGSVARRLEPLTPEQLLVDLAYIPGEGVCKAIFGVGKCSSWSLQKYDELGYRKSNELKVSGLRPEEIEKEVKRAAFKKILQRPGQFALLWFMEGIKMFFWESTQIGFVSYPHGLTKLFYWVPFKNGIRFLMSILTFTALMYLSGFLLRERRNFFMVRENPKVILFLSILLILLFSSVHALCLIVPRYALPIAPLYLVISAFFIQRIL